MPDILSKFQKNPSITFRVILLTLRQTDRQTNKVRQKHNLLGGDNKKLKKAMLNSFLFSKTDIEKKITNFLQKLAFLV